MELFFRNRRRIEGLDYRNEQDLQRVWLNGIEFSEIELEQLLSVVFQLYLREELTKEDVLNGDFDFFDQNFDGIAEVPIEWWDIVDENNLPLYQIWLCNVDAGNIVEAGTTNELHPDGILQGYWHGEDELGKKLKMARDRLEASREFPDSLILHIRF